MFGGIGGATNVYYVSTNGSDSAGRGGSIDTAFRTLKYACSNIGTPTATAPAVIFVKSGTYEEGQLPIIVPHIARLLVITFVLQSSNLQAGWILLDLF